MVMAPPVADSPWIVPARRVLSAWETWKLGRARRLARFAGQQVLSEEDANDAIAAALRRGAPFLAGRMGFHELDAVVTQNGVLARQSSSRWRRWRSQLRAEPGTWNEGLLQSLDQIAGFFPAEPEMAARLATELTQAFSEIDLAAIWFRRYEDELMRSHAPGARPILPRGLEPYYHAKPWSMALAGMRVLIVHPYEQSIRAQFPRHREIFGSRRVWPACELLTVKTVQTLAGERAGFDNWFDALAHMRRMIDAVEFDVAIVGAGAYGLPLAAHVKRMGKMAIHMGGATQLLFGIRGKRWDDRPEVTRLYNEHWVRPSAEETPPAHRSVENGAYW
ncbi:MAG: hypothetical protein AB7E72_05060 [Lysobacterales bacterium]